MLDSLQSQLLTDIIREDRYNDYVLILVISTIWKLYREIGLQ